MFLSFIVAYAILSSSMFELGENMRFRLETDPLVLAAVTAIAARLLVKRASWRGHDLDLTMAFSYPDDGEPANGARAGEPDAEPLRA